MFEFIRIQYQLGKIDSEKVQSYVGRWITQEQAEEIIGNIETI